MWFTEFRTGSRIASLTTTGAIQEYDAGILAGSAPTYIAAGPGTSVDFTSVRAEDIGIASF
jgi:hypothetical protein